MNALELLIGNLAAQNPTHLTGLSRWAALSAGPKVNQTAFSGAKYRLGRKFTVCIVYGLKTTHAWLWTIEHHIFGGFMKKLMMMPSAIYELPFNIEVSFFLFFSGQRKWNGNKSKLVFFCTLQMTSKVTYSSIIDLFLRISFQDFCAIYGSKGVDLLWFHICSKYLGGSRHF